MNLVSYSIEEASDFLRGGHSKADLQWVSLRLRRGTIKGFKSGRHWRMTEEQLRAAVEALEPEPVGLPEVPSFAGMTRTSRRRLAS